MSPDIQTGRALARVEEMLEEMCRCLSAEEGEMVIELRSRGRGSESTLARRTTRVLFPGRTAREGRKFGEW
jgi:hypothetical protein